MDPPPDTVYTVSLAFLKECGEEVPVIKRSPLVMCPGIGTKGVPGDIYSVDVVVFTIVLDGTGRLG